MNLTVAELLIILSWADFAVETGEGFEEEESKLYDKLNAVADAEKTKP